MPRFSAAWKTPLGPPISASPPRQRRLKWLAIDNHGIAAKSGGNVAQHGERNRAGMSSGVAGQRQAAKPEALHRLKGRRQTRRAPRHIGLGDHRNFVNRGKSALDPLSTIVSGRTQLGRSRVSRSLSPAGEPAALAPARPFAGRSLQAGSLGHVDVKCDPVGDQHGEQDESNPPRPGGCESDRGGRGNRDEGR